jgi:hypothetical protein
VSAEKTPLVKRGFASSLDADEDDGFHPCVKADTAKAVLVNVV